MTNAIYIAGATLAVLTLVICCCSPDRSASGNGVPTENGTILLEIYTKSEGMVQPVGTLLEIRVYSDGEAELETFMSFGDVESPAKKRLQRITLNEDDLNELKRVIGNADLWEGKARYDPRLTISDVLTTTSLTFRHKTESRTIVLQEKDTSLHLENKQGIYPNSLIKLLKSVEILRD